METATHDPPGYRDSYSTPEHARPCDDPDRRVGDRPADFNARLEHLLEIVREARRRGALTCEEELAVADLRISLHAILRDDKQA